MDNRKTIGLVGAGCLLLGAVPLALSTLSATVLSHAYGESTCGMVIVALGVLGILLAENGSYWMLRYLGLASAFAVGLTFFEISNGMASAPHPITPVRDARMFHSAAGSLATSVQWGWWLVLVGTALVLVAGLLRGKGS